MQGTRHLGWMLLAVGLLAAGSCRQLDPGTGEIRFRVEAGWQSGTKAAMYDDGTVSEGSFVVSAYNSGTANSYFLDCTVSYAAGAWSFDGGQRYWPASGTLDFHAWMPATRPSYITSPTYAAGNPGFTCSGLPLTTAGQATIHEYVYAVESNRGKDGGDVSLAFQRPFAKVRFQMDGCPGVTIHSITIENVYNNGVYTHASGWTSTGSAGNLVLQLNDTHYDEGTGVVAVGDPMLVKPQLFGTQTIVVDYTLDGGGPRTQKSFPVSIASWASGHGYTYTLNMPDWLSVGVSGEPISWTSELLGAGSVINWTSELLGAGSVINWASNIGSEGDDLHWRFTETASGEDFSWVRDGFGGPFTFGGKEYYISQGNMYKTASGYALYSDWTGGLDQFGNNDRKPSTDQAATGNGYFNWLHLVDLFDTRTGNNKPSGSNNNFINNGKTPIAGCYLPTQAQWAAFTTGSRPGSYVNGTAGCRYALIQLAGYTIGDTSTPVGLLLLPDNATLTGMTKPFTWNTPSTSGNTDVTVAELTEYLAKGCVFLPAAGYCYNGSWDRGGLRVFYWSAISNDLYGAYSLRFFSSDVNPANYNDKSYYHLPVRLLQE